MLIFNFFLKSSIFTLFIISWLAVSQVQGQSQKNTSKSHKLTLDKIYPGKKKVIFKDKLFDELNNIRVNQGVLQLKKKLLEYKNKIAYGILRFESDKKSLKNNKLVADKYDQSVWILIYSYKLHPENMLVFIDRAKDGFTYDDTDLLIDEVGYITPTSFTLLPILGKSDKSISFFIPYTDKNGSRKEKKIKISHGAVESKYYFLYKQAVNCIKSPYVFRPFKGSLITFSNECILPKPKIVIPSVKKIKKKEPPNASLSEDLEVKIPTSNDPNVKTVLMSNPDTPIYQRLSCVGVGKLGNKCVIYNVGDWKPFK